MSTYQTNVEIIRCTNCGRLGVALTKDGQNSTRITTHKCSGSWEIVSTQPAIINTREVRAEAISELKKVNGQQEWVKNE